MKIKIICFHSEMPMHPFALCLPLLLPLKAHAVVLSNVRLPRTTAGAEIITGEASVLQHGGFFFFFFNDWGSCPGVDCCASSGGCASCCFSHPPHPFAPGCSSPTNGSNPYGNYHVVGVRTREGEASVPRRGS